MKAFLCGTSLLTMMCLANGSLIFPRLSAAFESPFAVEGGRVSGVIDTVTGVTAFKGIPYAAPPVGDLRWREPGPVPAWDGVRKADHFLAPCVQPLRPTPGPGMSIAAFNENVRMTGPVSEDCLYLNVWTAAKSANERRAVMVWIPGGGFVGGSPSFLATDGAELARKGLVLVSISYRVGVLGFFAHPELTKESPHSASGNYGFLDQLAALRWVQKNISAFGGDPRRVTIFGQSAGAMSVHALTASPLARGLFQRVVATSGSLFPGNNLLPALTTPATVKGEPLREAEQRGLRFATAIGASSVRDLRTQLPEDLVKRAVADGASFSVAIVDGWFLPHDVPTIFNAGMQNDVPTVTGWDGNEGDPFAPPVFQRDRLIEYARRQFGDRADAFLQHYPAGSNEEASASYAMYVRDLGFGFPARTWARVQRRTGKSPVFLFFFERAAPDEPKRGAHHGVELSYAFHTVGLSARPFEDVDRRLADVMSSYWVQFASTGDPNGMGRPKWPAYDSRRDTLLVFGDKIEERVVPQKAVLDLFEASFDGGDGSRQPH